MKQFALLMMLVSFILNAFAVAIETVNHSFVELSIFYPTISLFIRYGELLFLFGLIGLWLGTKQDKTVKWLSLLCALTIGIKFFMIEFAFFQVLDMIPMIFSILEVIIIIGIIMKVSAKDCPLVVIKGYVSLGFLSIYIIHLTIYSFIASYQNVLFIENLMHPFFYIVFQLSLFFYFKEWYKEGFQYQNEVLYRM